MTFNHYAKIKNILSQQEQGWYIKRINEPTSAKSFKGETRKFDHYYRVYNHKHEQIKYCKFQQLDLLAKILDISEHDLPVIN